MRNAMQLADDDIKELMALVQEMPHRWAVQIIRIMTRAQMRTTTNGVQHRAVPQLDEAP